MIMATTGLVITSCGKVVCSGCQPKLSHTSCAVCHGPCTKVIPLDSRAPKDVQNLFMDINDQLKVVLKNYNFQENQKRSFLEFRERKVAELKKTLMAYESQKKDVHYKVAELKKILSKLHSKEDSLKVMFRRLTSPQVHDFGRKDNCVQDELRGFNHSNWIVASRQGLNESFRDYSPNNAFNVGTWKNRSHKTESKQQGMSSGPFLELKTPAVWYHKQQKQSAIGSSPVERLDDLCSRKPHERSRGSSLDGSLFFTASPAVRSRKA